LASCLAIIPPFCSARTRHLPGILPAFAQQLPGETIVRSAVLVRTMGTPASLAFGCPFDFRVFFAS
jgi:hypothetical protein